MAASVEELIVANVATVLGLVSIANGYNNDLGSVERWQQSGNRYADLPAVVISDEGIERDREGPISAETFTLALKIYVFVEHDEVRDGGNTDTLLASLHSDIHRALMLDHTRGGNALDTEIVRAVKFSPVDEQRHAGRVIWAAVTFRHGVGTPEVGA